MNRLPLHLRRRWRTWRVRIEASIKDASTQGERQEALDLLSKLLLKDLDEGLTPEEELTVAFLSKHYA